MNRNKALPPRWCFLCFYFFVVLWAGYSQDQQTLDDHNLNDSLGRVYAKLAYESISRDDNSTAKEMVSQGLSYTQRNSDLLYAHGHLLYGEGRVREAIEVLEQSIECNTYSLGTRSQSYELLLKLYLRVLDFDSARKIYESVSQEQILNSHKFTVLVIELLQKDSIVGGEKDFIDLAAEHYPDSLLIRGLQQPISLPPLLKEDQLIRLTDEEQADYFWYLERFIERLPAGETRRQWIAQYWELGGMQRDGLLALYIQDIADDPARLERILEEYVYPDPPGNKASLGLILDTISDQGQMDQIKKALIDKYGPESRSEKNPVSADTNKDGYWDEYYWYSGLDLTRWQRDSDQDGAFDLEISFENGLPTSASFFDPSGRRYDVAYSSYPYLKQVRRSSSETSETWELPPLKITLSIISGEIDLTMFGTYPGAFILEMEVNPVVIDTLYQMLEQNAFQKQIVLPHLIRTLRLRQGIIEGFREDRNNNGYFEIQGFLAQSAIPNTDEIVMVDSNENGIFDTMILEPGTVVLREDEIAGGQLRIFYQENQFVLPPNMQQFLSDRGNEIFRYFQSLSASRSARGND